ncbi:uncharacterized protein LOC131426905 [Malaya genurostris]|uniref:uncharacterized protein LOC131426905 n=1 Tax=Malaya genurostris TaxID=325434 RepID=UPI0026F39B51|nr:uncharacterized protein LOC131426905 [Malaya genurostris]
MVRSTKAQYMVEYRKRKRAALETDANVPSKPRRFHEDDGNIPHVPNSENCSIRDGIGTSGNYGAESEILHINNIDASALSVGLTCRNSLKQGKVPKLAVSNGFKYQEYPSNPSLPPLDPITERLISPRLPFMQIRRLRFATGNYGIVGQVINVPVDVDKMVNELPRQLEDDRAFNVAIKKHLIHKSTYLSGFVKKSTVKSWLQYLVTTPLYRRYNITFNENQLNVMGEASTSSDSNDVMDLETIENDNDVELLIGQQHTLLWDEDKCLELAPAQNTVPLSIIYDEHAEELSFPEIYLGHPRTFNPDIRVTPYMMATSELRRRDRRGAKPQHLLYVAMKILRLRVSEGLQLTFKCMATANITRAMLSDKEFLEKCVDRNLSLSASETKWPLLLRTLHKLSDKNSNNDGHDVIQQLSALQRATLVNEDPVTCCVYFNKFVDVIMQVLKSTRRSPFGQYHVVDYFKRIEFQHRGSPHAHILLWLANDPAEEISENMPATVQLIDRLCSVCANDLPESYGNQVHKHTFTCFKRNDKRCRFNIPYWPMNETRILLPITANDGRREQLKRRSVTMRNALETRTFNTLEDFIDDCRCTYEYYLDIIRASINRPTVLLKRSMSELWTNPFNPWIANILRSNMDLQFIPEAFSCAAYVVEYVNKTNRGISSLHRDLVKLQEEYPDQNYTALLKKLSLKMLNSVEMSAQEAAWYLLRQPMSEASRKVVFLPTMWPHERIKSRKRVQQMDEEGIENDSTDVWTLNIIQKYETRDGLDGVCLVDFAAWYTKERKANVYKLRSIPRVLRWCSFGMNELGEYKREMVLLFLPFRNELCDILDGNKFISLYDINEADILRKCKEYSTDLDLERTVQEYLRLYAEDETNAQENVTNEKHNEFVRTIAIDANNDDIDHLPVGALSAVKQRMNVMSKQDYCEMVRLTNAEQRNLVLEVINRLHSYDDSNESLQIFFTGPAGCGKTFTLRIIMETFNRFSQAHNSQKNAYVACASTGKAAVAINGTTVHSAFRITMSRRSNVSLSFEALQLYRNAFANVKAIIVDEVSMVGADVLNNIHTRLQNITGNYDDPFGGMNIIFCGDLRQLPPVNARPVYKPCANSMHGAVLWQSLDFFPLVNVMRQNDGGTFSEIVYDYDKSQDQQLVYVGLSRVTSLDGLYLTNSSNNSNSNSITRRVASRRKC